jgi:hypothetical protein
MIVGIIIAMQVPQAPSVFKSQTKIVLNVGGFLPCTKHDHCTCGPCLAFVQNGYLEDVWVIVQRWCHHWMWWAKKKHIELWSSCSPMTSTCLMNMVQQTLLSNSLLWFWSFDPEPNSDLKARPPHGTHPNVGREMSQKYSRKDS